PMMRALLIIILAMIAAAPARADNVRAAQRDGYGRIAFDWDAPIRYSADVVEGTLVVQFERPVTRDIASLSQTLTPYISGAGRFSADRRSLYFPLRPNITMRTFTVGSAVVFDLMPPTPAGQPRPLATPSPTTAPAAASGKPVSIRTGQHPDYFRIAFDW